LAEKKIILLLILILVLIGAIFIPGYLRIKILTNENRQLEAQMTKIQGDNKRLEEEHRRLLNDPLYLEEVARKKLGVVRKGEEVYKVVPQE
jgi:cell division protein FtsB